MAFCSNCGKQLVDGAKFCSGCGATVVQTTVEENAKRKVVYEGELHKCPSCGEVLGAFVSVCPACGYEIRGAKASDSVQELSHKLDEIEAKRDRPKSRGVFKRKWFDTHINELTKEDEQKITLIRNFAIPNTKEDLIEFLILAASNVDAKCHNSFNDGGAAYDSPRKALSKAWETKFDQAYQKANMIALDEQGISQVESINAYLKKKISKERKKGILSWILLACVFFWPLFAIIIESFMPEPTIEKQIEQRQNHLEYVAEQIEDDISYGRFEDARNKAYTLTFERDLSEEKSEYWEKKQNEILKQIARASGEQYDAQGDGNEETEKVQKEYAG